MQKSVFHIIMIIIIQLQRETNKEGLLRVKHELKQVKKKVGENNDTFEKVGMTIKNLSKRRDVLDKEHNKTDSEYENLKRKSPRLTFDEYRHFCTLKYVRKVNRKERIAVNHRHTQLVLKSSKLEAVVNSNFDTFKMLAFQKESLMRS